MKNKRKIIAWILCLTLLATSLNMGLMLTASATTATGCTAQALSDGKMPVGTNLLAGRNGTLGGSQSVSDGSVGLVTDGNLPGVSATNTGKLDINMWSGYGWASLTYTLDAPAAIDRLLVCSGVTEEAYRLYYVLVNAAATPEGLDSDSSLVAQYREEYPDSTPQALLLTLDKTVRAQYVRFSFFVPGQDVTGSASTWWGCARIGEVGVYNSVSGGSYCAITDPADKALSRENRLAGRNGTLGGSQSVGEGSVDLVTDGSLPGVTATNTGKLDINMWSGYGWAELSYALDERVTVEQLLVNSGVREAAYGLYQGMIYVSDSRETLYNDESKVISFDFGLKNAPQTMLLTLDTPAVGQYVGFLLFVPGSDVTGTDGQWWGCARIGELGVFACTAKARQTVVCIGDSITEGMHFTGMDNWDTAVFENNYPRLLGNALNAADDQVEYVIRNVGISGTAVVGSAVIGKDTAGDTGCSWMTSPAKPDRVQYCDVLTVMLGTNDAAANWDLRRPLYKQYYTEIVEAYRALNPDLTLYVLTSPCALKEPNAANLTEVVALQKELCVELGATLIDVYRETKVVMDADGESAFIDETDIAKGVRVHPGEAGHHLIADICCSVICGQKAYAAGGTIEAVTTEPVSASLIAGTDALLESGESLASGTLGLMTDGHLPGVSAEDTGKCAISTGIYADTWSKVTYSLGATYSVGQLLVGNSVENDENYRLRWGRVYVGTSKEDLYDSCNLVAEYAGVSMQTMLLTLDTPAQGCYVGFSFYVLPFNGIYQGQSYAQWWNQIRIGELGVYGEVADTPVKTGGTVRPVFTVPTEENRIAELMPTDGNTDNPVNYEIHGASPAVMTDGRLPGISAEDTGKCSISTGDYADTWTQLTYTLDAEYDIRQLLVGNSLESDSNYRLRWGRVYVSNTRTDLYDSRHLVLEYADVNMQALLLTLDTPTRGCYVGFSFYVLPFDGIYQGQSYAQWWNQVRVGELGVYGTYHAAKPADLTNLIAGKQPADIYLTEPGSPDRYNTFRSGYLNDASLDNESAIHLTDGDYSTRGIVDHQALDGRLPTLPDRYYISTKTPWAVLVYHLGGTAEVNQILLTSTGEWGDYFISGADFYVGQDLATLFDSANRVYSTGGEKTVSDEDGETVLDPAFDVTGRFITVSLDTPATGRYAAIVITRPTSTTRLGYSMSRIDELEVYGTLLTPEQPVITSFTDSTYHCTLTLHQLNFDDVAFFRQIDHLTVTREAFPAGITGYTADGWLQVDNDEPWLYTFKLIGKSGQVLGTADVGGRTADITIPNATGHMETLGQITDGAIVRVLNARTYKENLLGEDITGSWQFVPLVFDDSRVIYSGVSGNEGNGQVAGVAENNAPAVEPWLLIPAALLVMAGLTAAALRRRRVR